MVGFVKMVEIAESERTAKRGAGRVYLKEGSLIQKSGDSQKAGTGSQGDFNSSKACFKGRACHFKTNAWEDSTITSSLKI
jgi:hypothetical protein